MTFLTFFAGTRLLQHGFTKVALLEGENRIGGRIWTVPYAASVIDMGGQWCHGEVGNVVYEMAKPLGLLESSVIREDVFIYKESNGESPDSQVLARLLNLTGEVESREDDMKTFNGSVGSFMEKK